MNTKRILGEGRSFYHVVSRTVDKTYFFRGSEEKEVCRKILRKLEKLLGVTVNTYCFMSNHVHLLIEIPDPDTLCPLSEEELLDILPTLYDDVYVTTVKQALDKAKELPTEELQQQELAKILGRFEKRRGDLSTFVKEFKQRVTRYINKRNNRVGTLWESTFRSVLVEGNQGALLTIAAYIDLNPVRAGIVDRPEDYRWCGYAEALAGSLIARKGLGIMMSETLIDESIRADWRRTHNRYRLFLYTEGQEIAPDIEKGERGRKGFSEEIVAEVEAADGAMSIPLALRHKVRYFSDGAVLGSASFVNEVFDRERPRFGPNRKTGARKMKGRDWGALRVLRDLRINVDPFEV